MTAVRTDVELQGLAYELVLAYGSRVGSGFPVAYVLSHFWEAGYNDMEFIVAVELLKYRGLLTDEYCITERFFDKQNADPEKLI